MYNNSNQGNRNPSGNSRGNRPRKPLKKRDNDNDKRSDNNSNFKKRDNSSDRDQSRPNNNSGSKRPYKKREDDQRSDRPNPHHKTRDNNSDNRNRNDNRSRSTGTDRPFKRRDDSSNNQRSDRPYQRRDDSSNNQRSDRPYQRRDDSSNNQRSDRPYQRRDDNSNNQRSDRPYKRRDDNTDSSSSNSNYQGRDNRSNYQNNDRNNYSKRRNQKDNRNPENRDSTRLNKFIANSGICSRREADEYIKSGLVKINGEIITILGTRVNPSDEVRFNDQVIKSEKKVYIVLNKPKDYIATVDDPFAKKTVVDLIHGACKERVYPVGRLDRNTTGVLLLTNDGELTKKLTHPRFEKKKIYYVGLDRVITRKEMEQIVEGIKLDDEFVKADAVSFVDETDKRLVGIEIHSGQNRVVRRIFEYLNFEVVKLDRVYFAGLTKRNLKRGEWRYLSEKEIYMLKMGAYE